MTLFIVFFLTLFLIYFSVKRYNKLFNPFTLSLQIPLLFLIIPQLIVILFANGEDSILSDTVITLFIFSIFLGTYIRLPNIKIYSFRNRKLLIFFTYVLIIFFSIPLVPILLKFGVSFKGLREFYEYVVFSQYASFYAIIKVLLLFLVIFLFTKNRRFTLHSFALLIILCLTGSKMAIFSTAIIVATLWEEYRKMNYKYLILLSTFLFFIMIIYHFLQSSYVSENTTALDTALSYFDVYRQQTLALNMFVEGKINYFHGDISLSSWYKIIPRFLWADKPKDFGFALLNYKIYPEYAANGYMPSFGLAYTFADFGFFSIIISGLLVGFAKNYFYNIFYRTSKNVVAFLLYALDIDIILIIMFIFYYFISKISKNDS